MPTEDELRDARERFVAAFEGIRSEQHLTNELLRELLRRNERPTPGAIHHLAQSIRPEHIEQIVRIGARILGVDPEELPGPRPRRRRPRKSRRSR